MKQLFIAVSTLLLFMTQTVVANEVPKFSSNQKEQIERIVHDYLINNPKVLIEASRALQAKQREELMKRAEIAIKENRESLLKDHMSFSGNAKGDVVLVEFFDYKCVHCKRMASVIQDVSNDDKQLKVVYKQLPIFGGVSTFAAKAALASAKQEKYNKFHNALLNAKGKMEEADVLKIAKNVGLNVKKLKKDMKDPAIGKVIEENMKLAQKIGVMGTPAFIVVNNTTDETKFLSKFMPGAIQKDNLLEMISQIRSDSSKGSSSVIQNPAS